MTWSPDSTPLVCIVTEGAVDRFCGRPRDRNPYAPVHARDYWLAWDFGWIDADALVAERGREEARRSHRGRVSECLEESLEQARLVLGQRPEDKTGSDFAHDLERRLPVCQGRRLNNRTTIRAGLGIGGIEKHTAAFHAGDAPQRSAAAYQRPDGYLAKRRSMLDVAVWEPKGVDRRRRDADNLYGRGRRPVLCLFDTLHVGGQHAIANEMRHAPARALALHRIPDLRKGAASEVVFEVAVRVADQERLAGMSG